MRWIATADDETHNQRIASASSLWRMVEEQVIPTHAPADRAVLRVELWADSGRSVVFPARDPFEKRTDSVALEVRWPRLQRLWAQTESDIGASDEALDAVVGEELGRVVAALRETFRPERFPDVRVQCFEFGDERLAEW